MKVIDQINGSAIFSQSAYSASIATKDNLGRDITATYLTAHQSLDNYLTTADASTISSTLSGAISSISTTVNNNSGNWNEVYTACTANSGEWENISDTVQSNSASWNQVGLYVPLSATNCTIGNNNTAIDTSLAQGKNNSANRESFSQGSNNKVYYQSLAQGLSNSATWDSLGQGISNTAGTNALAQGHYNKAFGDALSQGSKNSANSYSLAQGYYNKASAYSLSQGYYNSAYDTSFSQGLRNSAFAKALVQGSGNTALNYSLAQGMGNSSNDYSLSQGFNCGAVNKSQALGFKVTATNSGMAIGKYNKITTAAFVVGNGYSAVNEYGEDTNYYNDCFIIYHDGSVSAAGKASANGVELIGFPISSNKGGESYLNPLSSYSLNASSNYLSLQGTTAGYAVTTTMKRITFSADGISYYDYPSTNISSNWYDIIRNANNSSNCYCLVLNPSTTSVNLENYSAYDKLTILHGKEYGSTYEIHWDGKTKEIPSGLYIEMGKVKDINNLDKWKFLNSGWANNGWWDYD